MKKQQAPSSNIETFDFWKKSREGKFLIAMDSILPWSEWIALIQPYCDSGKRNCQSIEQLLRMYLLQTWHNIPDEDVEDVIYDSRSMRWFMGLDLTEEHLPGWATCRYSG